MTNYKLTQEALSILKANYTDSRIKDFQKAIKDVINILEKIK